MSRNIALPAYISSLHSVRGLVDGILSEVVLPESNDLRAAEEEWKGAGLTLAEGVDETRQRSWSDPRADANMVALLERADQVSRARLLASACKDSRLLLHALPA